MSFEKYPPPVVGTGDVVGPGASVDDRIATFDGITGKLIQDSGATLVSLTAAILTLLNGQTYLTENDETATLANSRQLLAGTNVTFDDTVPGERTVNASGGGSTQLYVLKATFDGGGIAPTANSKVRLSVPVAGNIVRIRLLADIAGTGVVDIWKDTYANYPPTVADTIIGGGGTKPTLTAALKTEDTTLTGYTVAVAFGDTLIVNLDSAATFTWLLVELFIQP